MSVLLDALGRRVRQHRSRAGLTLKATADAAELSPRFLSEVEAGRGNISVLRLAALAGVLGVDLADLVARPDAQNERSIALLGLRGAGKTTVGRKLARRLKLPFVELDTVVASRTGLALGEVFSLYGEEYYREAERAALADLLAEDRPVVIATGGGLVTAPDTYALLRRHATTVWLKARPIDYWTRVARQGDERPMTDHPRAREALRELVTRRDPLYRQADVTIDTTALTVTQTITRLVAALA
jgi:XRE family aerobic/anaerobic benzoate catabolism transcriptional regulator